MSLQSYQAAQHDLSTKFGVREAAKLYNSAAGICSYIRKEVINGDEVHSSLDLTPSSLEFCEKLLLAQGQDCVYRMASSQPNTLTSVLAKLASAAVDLYAEALVPLQTTELLTKVSDWDDLIRCSQMLYRARAEYHESAHIMYLICNRHTEAPKDGYGVEIARLTVAQSTIEQALLYGERVSKRDKSRSTCVVVTPPLLEIKRLKRQIIERKNQAELDNNEIYHERLPSARFVATKICYHRAPHSNYLISSQITQTNQTGALEQMCCAKSISSPRFTSKSWFCELTWATGISCS